VRIDESKACTKHCGDDFNVRHSYHDKREILKYEILFYRI